MFFKLGTTTFRVANLIPGPNSTELAIHLGYESGRWLGLILAGAFFIVPAMLSVLALPSLIVVFKFKFIQLG